MQSIITAKKFQLHKLGMYFFNTGLLAGILMLSFGLTSCGGGGGGGGGTTNTTPTISYISPSGIVASSVPQTITIVGTNFVTGLTYSITNSSGVPYTISSSSLISPTQLSVTVAINTAPADNYAMFAIKSSGSSTTLASDVLGVAGTLQTTTTPNGIQTIFNTNCIGCHDGTTLSGGMNLTSMAIGDSTGAIGKPSSGCISKLRITPGDPRRSSSVLIDKIEATSTSHACSGSPMPYLAALPLSTSDIQIIVDWVAGGAKK
jgi:hypothetical protein